MKTVRLGRMNLTRWLGAIGLAVVLTGCATSKINWAARVGHYTYDQAITELGPPDREAKLSDGTIVADWVTRRGYRYAYPIGGYPWHCPPWYYGPFYPTYVDTYAPDYYLRLTFAPDGKLKAWKKFAK